MITQKPIDVRYGIGPNGSRLKIMRPSLRKFVVEVLKATVVYKDLLDPDQAGFAVIRRNMFAVDGDDMIVTPDAMLKFLDIAHKLNLKITI